MKAVTFSYDDGVTQDIRLVEILNRYNLKATFNLNSELLGKDGNLDILGKRILHNKIQPHEITEVYKNHEIAAHTLTHPDMTEMPADEVIRQVEQDRLNLSELSAPRSSEWHIPAGSRIIIQELLELSRTARALNTHEQRYATKIFRIKTIFTNSIHPFFTEIGISYISLRKNLLSLTRKAKRFFISGVIPMSLT